MNQFLCYLDGVEGRSGVFVMAATARPDLVDVALLRPGRIDKAVYCGFPSQTERKEMFEIYLKTAQISHETVQKLAQESSGFTCADVKGLC